MRRINVRNELIADAALKMRLHQIGAHEALEMSQAEGAALPDGTLGRAMRQYYLKVSDMGLTRLIKAVERCR
jgi:hypothetical protein